MSLYFASSTEITVVGKDGYIKFTQQDEQDGSEHVVWITVLQFEEICRQHRSLIEESLSTL